jgi:hypothetical protein
MKEKIATSWVGDGSDATLCNSLKEPSREAVFRFVHESLQRPDDSITEARPKVLQKEPQQIETGGNYWRGLVAQL